MTDRVSISIPPKESKKNIRKINFRKSTRRRKKPGDNPIINLLLEMPFMRLLPSYIIQEIYRSIHEQNFKNNEKVISQGDPITDLYIVKSGSFLLTINHVSIFELTSDIYSFMRYQEITKEPFLEGRKYELEGKITKKEDIKLFIYERKKFFGDIEIVTGKDKSIFNVYSNQENSGLIIIDRIKWVKLTKKIRNFFMKLTLKKIEIIYERIGHILAGKYNSEFNEIKVKKNKINEQLEVNNNFEIYSQKIRKQENKLNYDFDKLKLSKYNQSLASEKSKSLRNFQQSKSYLINLFKYPNILKEDIKSDLDKYLFASKNKDLQRFKLGKTTSNFNIEKINESELNLFTNKFNNLFITNYKNKSMNNIFESAPTQKIQNLKNMTLAELINNRKSNEKSALNKKSKSISMINLNGPYIIPKNQRTINSTNLDEKYVSQKMKNWLLKSILLSDKQKNEININSNKKSRNVTLKPLKKVRNFFNKFKSIRYNSERKIEKMSKENIDSILNEKYKASKESLIEKLLGNKQSTVFKNDNIHS